MTDDAKPETPSKQKEPKRADNWAEDQKQRGYYYDDAHGYEVFDPEVDDEEVEDDESEPSA